MKLIVRTLVLVVACAAFPGEALAARQGAIEVTNGAEPALSVLNLAPCDAPDARQNRLQNGETIATGSSRTFDVPPGCWIVSLKDGAASARFNVSAGRTEHYTVIEN